MNRGALASVLLALLVAPYALPVTAGDEVREASALDALRAHAFGAVVEPGVPPALASLDDVTLEDAVLGLYALTGTVLTDAGHARLAAAAQGLPAEIAEPTALVLAAMNEAAALRHAAFVQVSVEDARFAWAATQHATPLTADEEMRLEALLPRIDLDTMAEAAWLVLSAIEEARPALALAASSGPTGQLFADPANLVHIHGVGDDVLSTDATLAIDLGGNDVWENNAGATMPDFIIQAFPGCITTGGLDCTPLAEKRNGPALASVFGRRCSFNAIDAPFLALDHAEATDAFLEEQLDTPSVPALTSFLTTTTPAAATAIANSLAVDDGCLPSDAGDAGPWSADLLTKGIVSDGDEHVVAVAIDLGGDDRYAPPKEFNAINNGSNGPGCDSRDMGEDGKLWSRNLTAAGAFAGIGVLWDEAGTDFYGGRSLVQGTGHVGGVGVLVDRGNGNDRYEAVRLGQGAAIFAALGVLYDEAGDDEYAMVNDIAFFNEFEHFIGCDVSTRDGQGRANFNGVALLYDGDGDDTYHVQVHDPSIPGAERDDPTTTQGSTGTRLNIGPSPVNQLAALGFGALVDRAGADSYTRPGRADGVTDTSGTFVDLE